MTSTRRPHEPIELVIADDHVTVREGLAAMIGRQPDMKVVAEASNGADAVELWRKHRPDVTLLDLRMPQLDGVGAIEAITRENPGARVVVLTTFDTDNEIASAIKAGAKAYLLKDAPREELLSCIRRVHAGETCIPAALVAKLAAAMTREALTAREQEVLELLANGSSNRDIAASLAITETTVKSHLRNLFAKLGVISRTEAVAEASRRGLVRL